MEHSKNSKIGFKIFSFPKSIPSTLSTLTNDHYKNAGVSISFLNKQHLFLKIDYIQKKWPISNFDFRFSNKNKEELRIKNCQDRYFSSKIRICLSLQMILTKRRWKFRRSFSNEQLLKTDRITDRFEESTWPIRKFPDKIYH